MMTIQLLGGATMRGHGVLVTGPPTQRHRLALLALIAASWPQAIGRDRAMALLWPEHDTERARRLLNLAVHVLRRALGEELIVSAGDGLLLDPRGAAVDVHLFRAAVGAEDHDAAAAAWTGPLLDGFHLPESPEFHFWLDERRAELARAYEGALLALAERRRAAGDAQGYVGIRRRLAAADPFSGVHARELMLALEAAGDRAGAIRHAQEHARRLRDDMGLDMDDETTSLLQRLQEQGARGGVRLPRERALPVPLLAVVTGSDAGTPREDRDISEDIRDRIISRLVESAGARVAALDGGALRVLRRGAHQRDPADALVEARARCSGDEIQLRLRVVDAADGVFLLSTQLNGELSQLAALADAAVEAVTHAMSRAATAGALVPVAGAAVEYDIEEARLLCARGQHFCAKRDEAALRRAITCFERAIALTPTHTAAHTGLANTYAILGFYDLMAPREAFSLARQAAHTAHALNPADPNCHASLGYIAKYYDWVSAERELQTAITLDPQFALAHQWLGNYLVVRGEREASIEAMQRAIRLAPHSAIATAAAGWACYFAGDAARAIDYCAEALDLDAHLPMAYAWRGLALQELGRLDEAVAAHRHAASLMPGSAAYRANLAYSLACAGNHDAARTLLRSVTSHDGHGYVPPYEVGKAYLALGDRVRALRMLEAAFRDRSHSMTMLAVDPQLRPLHNDRRFNRLVARVGWA
jgi:DNA-binding SARP family transcriptional activator/Flp pilus assembly protein TadD